MSDATRSHDQPPAHMRLLQMATAYRISQAIYAAAALRLPDHLAQGPKRAAELAQAAGADPSTLHRLMRTLASLGLLTGLNDQRFSLTPLGDALKADAPGSAHAGVLTLAGPGFWRAFEHFLYSVQTGRPGWDKAWGTPLFDYFAQRPDEASLLSETMIAVHGSEPAAVAKAYDFSAFNVIVDVGGATGNMLAAVLNQYRGVKAILYDLPHVVRDAPALIREKGLEGRVSIRAGNFFESVPSDADAYLLSHVLHDWSEQKCLAILAGCQRAMRSDSRILIVEMVIPPGDDPHPGKMLDLSMMAGAGGQERTADEYEALLAKAGFRVTRVIPTESAVSIIEAVSR